MFSNGKPEKLVKQLYNCGYDLAYFVGFQVQAQVLALVGCARQPRQWGETRRERSKPPSVMPRRHDGPTARGGWMRKSKRSPPSCCPKVTTQAEKAIYKGGDVWASERAVGLLRQCGAYSLLASLSPSSNVHVVGRQLPGSGINFVGS